MKKISFNIDGVDFLKSGGLVPVVVQDWDTHVVLMLGYMDRAALERSCGEGVITFFSRSKNRLWTKGETSGNFLEIVQLELDCDRDTILARVRPKGPTCHTGADTCFDGRNLNPHFLEHLSRVIESRKGMDSSDSYTASLLNRGINKVAQKVGEEAVELVIEAKDDNADLFLGEAADLMYHYLVLLAAKNFRLDDVVGVLKKRHADD
jgi:phosphoribosyl-AMP cyclohydrolase / phosphoribosyl-ATP pyrophosphohydrolase